MALCCFIDLLFIHLAEKQKTEIIAPARLVLWPCCLLGEAQDTVGAPVSKRAWLHAEGQKGCPHSAEVNLSLSLSGLLVLIEPVTAEAGVQGC